MRELAHHAGSLVARLGERDQELDCQVARAVLELLGLQTNKQWQDFCAKKKAVREQSVNSKQVVSKA